MTLEVVHWFLERARGLIAEMLQDAINKDEKMEKDGKERTGVDKTDKAARDVKDKKEAKGVF